MKATAAAVAIIDKVFFSLAKTEDYLLVLTVVVADMPPQETV